MPLFGNIGKKVVEEFFLALIEDFDETDIEEAVEKDTSLLKVTSEERPDVLRFGEKLAKRFSMYSNYLTFQNIMIWLSEKRPDFYEYLKENEESRRWLRKQVSQIKKFLFS